MNWLNSPYVLALFPVVLSALLLLVKGQILKLPSWAQPFVPILCAGIPVVLDQYQAIGAGPALLAGLLAGLEAIGVYHAVGKARRSAKPEPSTLRSSSALVVLLALALPGCGILKSASDEVASICEGYLAAQPEVQAEARAKSVSPLVIAEAICMANDAGRAIWELFQVRQSEPGVMMAISPDQQLENAKDHALVMARKMGLIGQPGTNVDRQSHTLVGTAVLTLPDSAYPAETVQQ